MFSSKLLISLATLAIVFTQLVSSEELNYNLRCYHDLSDCTLVESIPFDLQLDASDLKDADESQSIKKRSVDANTDMDSSRGNKLQKVIKKFIETNGESHKAFKTNEVNCLTGDCRVLTAKISKRARGYGQRTLACVGDPYANSGSRCVPIEGLYIG